VEYFSGVLHQSTLVEYSFRVLQQSTPTEYSYRAPLQSNEVEFLSRRWLRWFGSGSEDIVGVVAMERHESMQKLHVVPSQLHQRCPPTHYRITAANA